MREKTSSRPPNGTEAGTEGPERSVFVVSDVRLYREGLIAFLGSLAGISIAGSASDPAGTLRRMETHVDAALVDMSMRGALGLCRDLLARDRRVVALGMSDSEERMADCAMLGLHGYVSRAAGAEDMAKAIHRVCADRIYCDPDVAALAVSCIGNLARRQIGAAPASQRDAQVQVLTRRELQIARLIVEGQANKEIARHLRIEVSTVKNHVHSILGKYGARSRAEAAYIFSRGPIATAPAPLAAPRPDVDDARP